MGHGTSEHLSSPLIRSSLQSCYAALGPFKKAYSNYRDDHDRFRYLRQCSGVLEVAAVQILVHLMPRVNYAPRGLTLPAPPSGQRPGGAVKSGFQELNLRLIFTLRPSAQEILVERIACEFGRRDLSPAAEH